MPRDGSASRCGVEETVNCSTIWSRRTAWPSVCSMAALVSSTSAALCWVISSIWRTAIVTSSMADACVRLPLAMASRSAVFSRMASSMPESLPAALPTNWVPPFTSLADCSIRTFTSAEALAADWARRRTSTATTAKPLPASPARAASTDALSARRLVWKAMSSMRPMMLEILAEEAVIRSMALVAWFITSPPSSAAWETLRAFVLAASALAALSSTVEASCSIVAEVSSIVAA